MKAAETVKAAEAVKAEETMKVVEAVEEEVVAGGGKLVGVARRDVIVVHVDRPCRSM